MRFREATQCDYRIRDTAEFTAHACAEKFRLPVPSIKFFTQDSSGGHEHPYQKTAFVDREMTVWVNADLTERGALEAVSREMYRSKLKRTSGGNIDDASELPALEWFGQREGLGELLAYLDREIGASE